MIKKICFCLLILSFNFFSICIFASEYNGYNVSYYSQPYFNKLVVDGNISVDITNGNNSFNVAPFNNKCTKFFSYLTKNNTLVLAMKSCDNTRIYANVSADNFWAIETHGSASVTSVSNNFHANHLEIYAYDNSAIHLDGKVTLCKIVQKSHGKIELMWVESPNLCISGNHSGPIYLAGVVKDLFVKLDDCSYFAGRYLRTDNAIILASKNSRADVLVKKRLNAYADNSSLITYYKSTKSTIVTKNSGNVLMPETVR